MAAFVDEQFDIVILDVTLGAEYEAGFDLCRQFREMNKTVPIIFLTEHDDEADRISGLRMGADDYLGKTISGAYLAARVNALLRRVDALRAETASPLPVHGPDQGSFLRIDDRLSRAYWEGHPLELSLTQFWILRELFSNAGVVRSVSELMRAANITVQPNTIVVHIKSIREEFNGSLPTSRASNRSEHADIVGLRVRPPKGERQRGHHAGPVVKFFNSALPPCCSATSRTR